MYKDKIIVVSGLPRSGTSLMMQILQAAGIPLLTDAHRPPDINNPRGYYEFEPVKSLASDVSWLARAQGKAVKIISYLLPYLPSDYRYQIIFMNRNLKEIIQSQNKMLKALGKPIGKLGEAELEKQFGKHLSEIHAWLRGQPGMELLDVDFNTLMNNPPNVLNSVWSFLGIKTPLEQALAVIDPKLYRSRHQR